MVNAEKSSKVIYGLKPVLLMVAAQAMLAGVTIFYKLAANDGMVLPILIAYRFLFSTVFMVPLAIFVERKKKPKLTWRILLQAFLCGLFGGSLSQNLYVKALTLTSATFVAATTNLVPAITFVLAVCFRMERLGWNTSSGLIKIIGTLLGVGGAMLLTFYKGVDLHLWKTNVDLLKGQNHESNGQHSSHWLMGSFLAFTSCITYSMWLIIQTNMVKTYPYPYSVTALTSTIGSVQAVVYGLCTERHWSDWKLGWNVRLVSVAYTGIIGSGFMFVLITWCVHMKGPLFVSSFNPLMIVIVAIAGSLILNESLHLGSVLGAILIVCGLYAVLWGKAKEMRKAAQTRAIKEQNTVMSVGVTDVEPDHSSLEVGGDN